MPALDVNECLDDALNICDGNATCFDTDGSFTCSCNMGYSGNGTQGNCLGMIISSFFLCSKLAILIQFFQSEVSMFFINFSLHIDLNECIDSNSNNCHPNAECINTIGSFQCSCLTGFSGDGLNCSGKA